MSTRAVLFDLDDTLIDHRHKRRVALTALVDLYPALGRVPIDDLEREYEAIALAVAPRTLAGNLSAAEAGRERMRLLALTAGLGIDPRRAGKASDTYDAAYRSVHRPIPGALELLASLRGRVKTGLITNGPVTIQTEKVRAAGLEGLLGAVVISEAVGVAKPDPAIFREALGRIGSCPGEAVFVGDNWQVDILGARAAGMRALWLNRYGVRCPDPDAAPQVSALEPTERVVELLFPSPADRT